VAGSVASFKDEEFDKLEITYWIGRGYWGNGFAYVRSEEVEEYILKLEASETGDLIDVER
jgi:RimJ/RimL family protein N-acetyltransferase